ncbi:MAG: FeoB-associated Cys-rich membrane protein [Erysipelotrichaceae bacterium]|nr:FeoB-associated Cys-rich membrane protein [Erysipelotrichaceae bacterium]
MNPADIIVVLIIAVILIWAVNRIRKDRNSCQNSCSGCAFASGCTKMKRNN